MSTYNRYTYLASKGDLPVKAAGEKVILPGKSKNVFSVFTGEIVVWDQKKNITLAVGDIATAQNVSIGVGVGPEGSLCDEIMHIAGEQFNMCDATFDASVTKPSCGVPQVVDVFFDCTKCEEVHTLAFLLDDSRVRSTYRFNEKAEYVFSVPTTCGGCDTCDPDHNCEELACQFVDTINGNVQKDPSKITYFQKANLADQYQPFTASRIFNSANSRKVFCMAMENTACEDCVNLSGVTGIKIDGTTYPFTYTTKVGDPTVTLPAQMERVVEETNRVLEDIGGSAVISESTQKCCPYNITINTCATVVQYVTAAGDLDPCQTSNPFETQYKEPLCKGCGATPNASNLTCGFSIIVDPMEVDCNCAFPPNEAVPNYYGRTIEPAFAGTGWEDGNHYWAEAQGQQLPVGLGYFWQDKAHYGNHKGGSGRNFRYSNRSTGRIGLPDAASRASNSAKTISCEETYCVYNMVTTQRKREHFNNAVGYQNTDVSYVLIPEKDTATKASFEPYLTALQLKGICAPGSIACGVQNDMIADGTAVAGVLFTIDVAANDVQTCGGAITYKVSSETNASTTSFAGSTLSITTDAKGKFVVNYEVLCDGILIGESSVTGLSA